MPSSPPRPSFLARRLTPLLGGAGLALALLVSGAAHANVTTTGRITRLNIPSDGKFIRIEMNVPIGNPGCPSNSFFVRELTGSEGEKYFVNAVISAYLAGRNVTFWTNACTAGTYWGMRLPSPWDIYLN